MAHEYNEWLQTAETDYGVAKHLYETYRPQPLEVICYHCQQSAEKALQMAEEFLAWARSKV